MPHVRQAIGVKTARVERRSFCSRSARAAASPTTRPRAQVVSMRYAGWVKTLAADFTASRSRAGRRCSPSTVPRSSRRRRKYLSALRYAAADLTSSGTSAGAGRRDGARDAARQRLLSFGLAPAQVAQVARSGRAIASIAVPSPASGVVIEKSIVQGSPFSPGQCCCRSRAPIRYGSRRSSTSRPAARAAGRFRARDGALPRRAAAHGRVTFVAPALDPSTRTGMARIALSNPGGALKPGMFVDVTLDADLGVRLVVPEGAVVPTGTRQLVFVDKGGGRLEPREVTVGARGGEWIAIDRDSAKARRSSPRATSWSRRTRACAPRSAL
jgi:multidrug efflux pump subunit AcrA (membrane-fusion protein)